MMELSFSQACVIDSPKYEPNRCNINIINIPLNRVSSMCCQLNPTPLLEAFNGSRMHDPLISIYRII